MYDLKKYEKMLKTRLKELDGRLHRIEDHMQRSPDRDWAENAQAAEMDEVLEELGQAGVLELDAIQSALARIKGGTYGVCVRCGDDISHARLSVVPHTTRCCACANIDVQRG